MTDYEMNSNYGKGYDYHQVDNPQKRKRRKHDHNWTDDGLFEMLCYFPHKIDDKIGGDLDEENTLARIGKWCVYVGVFTILPLFFAPFFIIASRMYGRVVWCCSAISLIILYALIFGAIAWAISYTN